MASFRLRHRRKLRGMRVIFFISGLTMLLAITILMPFAFTFEELPSSFGGPAPSDVFRVRSLLATTTPEPINATTTTTSGGEYPPPLFTDEQLRQGAITLHVIGIIYMFVALAIVCDEFFVPALNVIIERLKISQDVAGATFMAAGGSAPELFTSLIGIFFAKNNIGIGTIVGSAVFNILFVIGMCAVFSKDALKLTWWPLFRDVVFYSIALLLLIGFFLDNYIQWWESLLLIFCYLFYVLFMKFNERAEHFVKSKLGKKSNKVDSSDNLINVHHQRPRAYSMPILLSGSGKFRQGMLHMLINTLDPMGPTNHKKHNENSLVLSKVSTFKVVIETPRTNGLHPMENGKPKDLRVQTISNGDLGMVPSSPVHLPNGTATNDAPLVSVDDEANLDGGYVYSDYATPNEQATSDSSSEAMEVDEPLDLSWPKTMRKRISYVLVAPLIFLLWITLPDTRREESKKYFPITFVGSILWIAVFSYMMVWWANTFGSIIGIPNEVMGLTIIAAGTSIPDLITSIIVAKKGYGDMAVSSSIGSNIFDITIGLPVPWILYTAIYSRPVDVNSKGLFCSIVLLFIMLMLVILSIAGFKWRMTKTLGGTMFLLYFVFITLSVLLEYTIIQCPI